MSKKEKLPKVKAEIQKYLLSNKNRFAGKVIIDFPAGNGITTKMISDIGAVPLAFDLFPEYFEYPEFECLRANIRDGLPVDNSLADALICQEGIEHFTDQLFALQECNRVLKPGGALLITTPNYSNIRSRLSYFLMESERFNSMMPPNEYDSVWLSEQSVSDGIYYGHIFLIGIQKLRVLARLSGFSVAQIFFTEVKPTSLVLFPLLYPFIFLSNWITYLKNARGAKREKNSAKLGVYREIFRIGINPKILLDGTLMVEFRKETESGEVPANLRGKYETFGKT